MSLRQVLEKVEAILVQGDPFAESFPLTRGELLWVVGELRHALGDEDPNEFRLAKARKEEDCRHMTAEDSLLDVLREIRALPKDRDVRLILAWLDYERGKPEGEHKWHSRYANVTKSQSIAYAGSIALEGQLELLGK